MADYYVDSNGNVTKKKKKKNEYSVDEFGKITMNEEEEEEDIAPLPSSFTPKSAKIPNAKKETEERTWFQKGALRDGFSVKNLINAVDSTADDLITDALAGVLGIAESTVDGVATLAGGGLDLIGADRLAERVKKAVAYDALDEQWVAKNILRGPGGKIRDLMFGREDIEEESFFGDKTDSLAQSGGQLAGQIALQYFGVPWWATTGATSFGGSSEEAFKKGANYGEAITSAAISTGAELLTEKLFGGSGLGEKGLINLEPLTKGISNKLWKTLADFGIDMAAEGSEEIASQFISTLGQQLTYEREDTLQKLLTDEEAMDKYIRQVGESLFGEEAREAYGEAFIGGAVLGGGANIGNVAKSIKQKTDYRTGLNAQEETVFNHEYNNRIADAEKGGKKLTKDEKAEIYDDVMEALNKGRISTDTIEKVLGGDDYTAFKDSVEGFDKNETYNAYKDVIAKEKEYNKLSEKETLTPEEESRFRELDQQLEEFNAKTSKDELRAQLEPEVQRINALKSQLRQSVSGGLKSNRLLESYRELQRSTEKYQADVSKYKSEAAQKTLQNLIDGGIANNTNEFHEFADLLAQISEDKGVVFDLTDNAKLKGTRFEVKGATVNAFVTDDGFIAINNDSNKKLNSLVGHEITHVLEGTQFYGHLQKAVKDYAMKKGEWDSRLKATTELYKKHKPDADPVKEVTADLIGDYVFNDYDFVYNLATTNPTGFKKVWNEIKYLAKIATTGSKNQRALEKAKHAFEKAWRESGKIQTKAEGKGEVKDSITEAFTDSNGNHYDNAVLLDTDFFDGISPRNWGEKLQEEVNRRASDDPFILPIVDENGNTTILQFAGTNERVTKDGGSEHKVLNELTQTSDNISKLAVIHIDEIVSVSEENVPYFTDENSHGWLDKNGWLHRNANVINQKNGNIYNLTVDIAKTEDGRTILYATNGKIKKVGNVKVDSLKIKGPRQNSDSGDIISQNSEKSSGSVKNSLSEAQEEYFKDSVVRDENGNLKVMYHGTSQGGHTMFDPYGKAKYGLFGAGSYFTDSKTIAESYTKKGKGNQPQVYETYLNITNPIDMDVQADPAAWQKALPDAAFPESGTNEDFYRAMEEYFEDNQYPRWEAAETAMEVIEGMGYDGITHIGGGRVNADGERHQVYIAFQPEQIKNIDNVKPTSDPDIRFSLSEAVEDTNGRELSTEQQDFFALAQTRDENGKLKPFYHGTARADRVGTVFDPNRATSGPMAFFTDNQKIADNYARDKADTSLAYDSDYDSYETQFRVNRNGKDMSVVDLWYALPMSERNAIKEKAKHVTMDDDWENVVYSEDAQYGLGNFDSYELNRHKGNALHTLVDSWLTDGNIFGEEQKFLDVLRLVGIEDAIYKDPDFRDEKTYEVYLNITNPFDTSNISDEMVEAFRQAAEEADFAPGNSADMWDKRNVSPELWMERLEDDIRNGTTNVWTSIPDFVTDVLKAHGYDGIFDTGGKGGGEGHTVAIPFYSEQIKSVDNRTPTSNIDINLSLSENGEASQNRSGYSVYGDNIRVKDPSEAAFAPFVTDTNVGRKTADVPVTETEQDMFPDDYAPLSEEETAARQSEILDGISDEDAPPEVDAPYYGEFDDAAPYDPFENRDMKEVGNRQVKAYMYENPEVKPFFQSEANIMLGELKRTTKGEKWFNDQLYYDTNGEKGWGGTTRQTSDEIAYLLDELGYTYAQIEKGLNAIIEDDGAENNAISKRIEFLLHDRLSKGYIDFEIGHEIPANQDYVNLLAEKGIAEYNDEARQNFFDNADQYAPPMEEDIAPVVQSAPKMQATEDIAPVVEEYEAITPKKSKPKRGNKLVRADNVTAEQVKIAEVLDAEPGTTTRKSRAWAKFKANVLDKGAVFEDISLKTRNRELMGKWNYMLYSEARAQALMGSGTDSVKSLNNIRDEVAETGKTKEFYEYLYHQHNVDRMSLVDKADAEIAPYVRTFWGYTTDEIATLARKRITQNTSQEDADLVRQAKEYVRLREITNKPVFGDSVTAQVSRDAVAQYEKVNPEFKQLAQDVYDYNNHLRKLLVDGGVISQETADLWAEMYPHYVPIRRTGDNGLNINVPLDTGRTGVNAPIKRATGGNSDIMPLFDTMAMRTAQTFKAIAKNSFGVELKNTLGTTIESNPTGLDEVIDSIDQQDGLLQEGKNGRSPTFTVFENGEKVTYEITEDMYDAMKPMSEGMAYTNKVLNTVSNVHRGVLTEYNPVFMLTNAVKDIQDVFINSQHSFKTYAKVPEAFAQLTKKGYWYQEYMANGGDQNTYFDNETHTFKTENKGLAKLLDLPPLSTISKLNNFIEMTPRLAEYIASREAGRSVEVSMLDAARVTTNFRAGGDITKFLNRNGATFLNASVQGAMQQVRNVREANANGLKGWVNLATKFALAGLPVLLLNGLVWEDDEEYEELSDYVKQNYYIVGKYGDGKFIRIPKGRTMAVIQNAFEQIANAVTGDDEADLKSFLELAVSNLAPNNPIENNILSPIIQVANNETWYGEDLVPKRLQDLPAAEQFDESTDSFSKWLGGKLNISPYKINYLLDQYSGGVGDTILPMITPEAESGDNSLGGNLLAPLKSKFTADSVMNNQNVSDFYDKMDELTKNAKSRKATDKDVLMYKYMNSVNADLSELYAKKREIQNSNLSDSQKYAQVRDVQEQIVELTRNALNAYNGVSITDGYATVGDRTYTANEDGEWQKVSDKQLEKQKAVTSALGISASDYWSNKKEYDYAYENPGKYAVAKSVGGYDAFKTYSDALNDITADKDSDGKTISGSRKEKVAAYISDLNADYGEKIILFKSEYPADDSYNREIIEYLDSRSDISYEEMVTILTELGFKVNGNTVTWD